MLTTVNGMIGDWFLMFVPVKFYGDRKTVTKLRSSIVGILPYLKQWCLPVLECQYFECLCISVGILL